MNLRKKVTLGAGIATLLLSLALGVSVYMVTESVVQAAIARQQLELARQTMDKIDRFLYERLNQVTLMSEDEEFEGLLAGKDLNDPNEVAESDTKLREMALYTGPWDALDLIDTDGTVFFSTQTGEQGVSVLSSHITPAAFAQLMLGEAYYSDVMVGDDGDPTMTFAAPVRDETTAGAPVVGAVMGHLSWETVLQILQDSEVTIDRTVDLFNRRGIELGDDSLENFDEILEEDASHHPAVREALLGHSGSRIFESIDEGNPDGLISYVPERGFLAYAGNGWVLTVETPKEASLAGARKTAALIVLILLPIIIIFGFVVVLLFRRFVLTPITTLTDVSKRFAGGEFSAKAQLKLAMKSEDEIGDLSRTLYSMASELEDLYANLEQKVKDRSVDLQTALEKVGAFAADADQQRTLYELMLASIGDAVIVTDASKAITVVNAAAERLFLYSKGEFFGKPVDAIVKFVKIDQHPIDADVWDKALKGTTPVSLQIDINVLDKKGIAIPVSAALSPILNKEGEHTGLIAVIRDIREQRQLEETRISFISVASHQLRTPLTSMRWFSEMLLAGDAGPINDEQKHFVERIYQGTDRMINLVSLLLQIARVEARRLKVDPVQTDLKQLTKGVELSLKSNLDAKKQIVLVTSEPEDFPTLMIDQEIVWQAIQNLLSNAIRYSPEKATIEVHLKSTGATVEYSVKDRGIGIPESEKDKIFQKFYRAENALRYVPEGSGLGLSLVKSLVEGWGGKIWFESKEGAGTTFTFTIPASGMQKREGEVSISI